LLIGALRASNFDLIMKNTEIMQCRPVRAFFLFRKWKGGRDDESILKEKWLTFHDHKWLSFKRPLTEEKGLKIMMRIPGPGEPGFKYIEQKNLVPQERIEKKKIKRK